MNHIQAIILGIIQGVTEFLPISSSGHLVITQNIFAFTAPPVFFDVLVHLGTLLAIIIFFRKQILSIKPPTVKAILLATIPTGLIGLILNPFTHSLFNSTLIVSIGLFITTLLLFSLNFLKQKNLISISLKSALIIGLAQGLAIIPGVSRSGATIVTALWLGLSQATAFSFSFLLSIPAIIAALALQFSSLSIVSNTPLSVYALGFTSAVITGFICLNLLKVLIKNKRLKYFAIYTVFLSLLSLIL